MTDFKTLVQTRRSVRKYTDQPIDADDLKTILRAALMSPTGKSVRGWHFIVVDDNVWMLGCSLNEFGNRATTLIRVPKDYKQKLIDRALEWWNDETLTVDIYDVEEKVNIKRKCFICKWFDKLCRW